MKTVADVLGVARSHLHDRVRRPAPPRGAYRIGADEELLPLIHRLVGERPTYRYRRVTALVNKVLVAEGKSRANHKRIFLDFCFNGTPAAAGGDCTTARSW
jgi:putative transposase